MAQRILDQIGEGLRQQFGIPRHRQRNLGNRPMQRQACILCDIGIDVRDRAKQRADVHL
ncbi:hypothetical protein GALL_548720 [mine drainage metagenome]|uniref:Uncharacterized protein n=1 Tax=mine drainage metagenome TaxID=410659 RepID=A0A1J5P802_9ZZZZ